MKTTEITGSILQYKSTDYIDASEGLVGKTRKSAVGLTIKKLVEANNVIGKGGNKNPENRVLSVVFEEIDLMMRVNATKRRMLINAANSIKPETMIGLKIRLYQTLDSCRAAKKGDAIQYTTAIAMDVQARGQDKWLRYFDWQQPKGRQHVINAGLNESGLA